ncbi:MAG: hypothetical protein ACE5HT_04625 [Gemmatimonadales bacterium]
MKTVEQTTRAISALQRVAVTTLSALSAIVMLSAATQSGRLAVQTPSFVGKWHLNAAKSDDARQKMREMFQSGGGFGGRRGGGGGGRGGGRGGFGGGGRGGGVEQQRSNPMRVAMRAAQYLDISQDDNVVKIGYGGDSVRTLQTDGQKIGFGEGRRKGEIKSHWKGDKLIVETKMEGGTKITETYELKDEGEHLQIKVRIENLRFPRPLEIKRIYDHTTS